ncbi:MAG: eukaryotic-like serine/threonine-protein kinase [Blastocatellia bacterium]
MPKQRPEKYIDKYEILGEIGRGGMGAVYKAIHSHFKKYVAIKEILPDLVNNAESQRQFEHEAEILAQLPSHPNIVTVRDALVWNGRFYMVMDYIEGDALNAILQQGAIDPETSAALLSQILAGLEAIHGAGILHRDIKSSNILVDREGTAYISDFGIAERMGRPSDSEARATAKYAAPELLDQRLGRGGLGQQIDIYAAGMVAFEMLLGERGFRESFSEVYNGSPAGVAERWFSWHTNMARTLSNLNAIDPSIPEPLARVVERMLAKDVNIRYRDVGEVRRNLAACMSAPQTERHRRPPIDDPTMPIDRMRRGGGRPADPVPVDRETVEAPPVNRSQRPSAAKPSGPLQNIPSWAKWAGAAALLLVTLSVVLFAVTRNSEGFTLIVSDAPLGSEVYVDDVRRGITSANGRIYVWGLRAGSRDVRVLMDGKVLYNDKVLGENGKPKEITMAKVAPPPSNLIEYRGPMVLIPAGDFEMGDDNHLPDERPRHKVSLPDYYIDKFEVTNRQYKEFCDTTGRKPPANDLFDPKYFENDPDSPVLGVSWEEAAAYARWAKKRLATEAEWEKAASWDVKTSTKRQWPWGDSPEPGHANIGTDRPIANGQASADVSSYGVYNMAGNVGEWVDDLYKPYPGGPGASSSDRVVRGASFFEKAIDEGRTTRRFHFPAGKKSVADDVFLTGFRCAVTANDPDLRDYLRAQK